MLIPLAPFQELWEARDAGAMVPTLGTFTTNLGKLVLRTVAVGGSSRCL